MGLFFFFNNRKPRSFEHKPIYWNPQKESTESRVNRKTKISFPRKKRSNKYKLLIWVVLLLLLLLLLVQI